MNIFFLSDDPEEAARWHCNIHTVSQTKECAQMFSTNFSINGIEAPYKPTHPNHPSTAWIRTSLDNFNWAMTYAMTLCDEYTERYGKVHKSQKVIEWARDSVGLLGFEHSGLTEFAVAINEESKCRAVPGFEGMTPVQKYRMYYIIDKAHLHRWKRNKPHWIENAA